MSSVTLSALQQAIIAHCKEHESIERLKPNFRPCVVYGEYFVKYGDHRSLYFQSETQKNIYGIADGDPSAPRVPRVHDYFTTELMMAYLVMEYINAESTPARDVPEMVAEALQWLRRLPAPSNVMIGSVGGGPARHAVFKDYTAPLLFSSKEALQSYMNKALESIPRAGRPKEISFSDERLVFAQSDMDESNFFIDTNGKMCIIDFEDVGLLPESFASYTVHSRRNPFTIEVVKHLDWSVSPNLHSMARAGAILKASGNETLGLDENGFLMARR